MYIIERDRYKVHRNVFLYSITVQLFLSVIGLNSLNSGADNRSN